MKGILTKFFAWCDAKSEVLQNKEEIVLAKIDAQKEEEASLKEYTTSVERFLSTCNKQKDLLKEEITSLTNKVSTYLEQSHELTPELSDSLFKLKMNQSKIESLQNQIQEFNSILEAVNKKALHLKHSTNSLKDVYENNSLGSSLNIDSWSKEEALKELRKFLNNKQI